MIQPTLNSVFSALTARVVVSVSLAIAGVLASSPVHAQGCPAPRAPTTCDSMVPGTPLPYSNSAAPTRLSIGTATTVDIEILGHSESRGYHRYLQPLLDANPPIAGVRFRVTNRYIGGHEAWRWATAGQRGYTTIQTVIQNRTNPVIVLGLFSNNVSYPIGTPTNSDANYRRFVDNLETIADKLYARGSGVLMTYFSAHRYKPGNLLPSYYENCAIGELMSRAVRTNKGYFKAGPEQHDLHRCCFPTCYARDQAHTNAAGDQLMAEAWYALLARELAGCASEPFGRGTAGTGNLVPVLAPTGGSPRLGNTNYSLNASKLRAGTPIGYVIGGVRLGGPLLLARPDVVLTSTASAAGEARLALPIPPTPSLAGGVLATQVLALDQGAATGISASQGLSVSICR